MKKAFISIYVLLILLVFGLTITFIYKENDTNFDTSQALYNKKIAMYEAESLLNILIEEGHVKTNLNDNKIIKAFYHKSDFEIYRGDSNIEVNKVKDAKVLSITAQYKGTMSQAILTYGEDENTKAKISYKRVY
ncbi:hypothetical protein [uncultured Anaerococcus sp.]|uniref:hypothetical protein n=1 Tax=uncultured Anaerococcus sp. TaxID=293428 RepID=UPI0028893422|nr:hypothetical protein [uncultured Anaerococcus sp.]